MDISKGQVAAVAIIIAVLAQGLGGFLANADTVTSCESRFDYLTDVYGSFKGTGQDIPVDFNPRENVTGYYAYDPTDPVQSQQIKNTPAIIYNPAQTANNYPYINQPMDVKKYTIQIDCTSDRTGDDWDSEQEEYTVTVTEYADGGERTYGPITWEGSDDRQNPAWYSGVYHESLGHLTNSRIWIQGEMHQAPRVLNLMDLYNHLDGIGTESLSLFDGADLNLACRDVSSAYPTFMADLAVDEDKSIFHDTFNLVSDSEYASYCYLNRSTGTVEIHASNYAVTSQWLVFGSSSTDSNIKLDVLSHKMDPKARYIDPRQGVSPSHQVSEYTYSEDHLYFAEEFMGGMEGFAASRPDMTGVFSLTVTIGEQQDRDRPEIYDTKDLLKCTIRVYGEGYGPQGHQVMACEFSLQDSSTVVFNPVFDLSQYGPTYDYYISWSFTETEVHIEAWAGQDSTRRTYDGDLSDITGTVVRQSVHTHMEEEHGQMMTAENLWVTDSYNEHSGRDPDYRSTHGELNEDLDVATAMYQVEHEYITVPFSSEATYWNNGYGNPDPSMGSGNGNSLIGMVLETRPLRDGRGRALPTETPFNICMHYEDPLNPGQYINSWLYNDPLKKGISIWTDLDTRMVYIGHYNAEGIRQDGTAMQIGVCDHVYVELRVDKGNLSVWAAPIYQFTSFLEYKASPLMDQTASVQGILPVDHPQYKSMAQLSYNVQPVGIGPYSMGAPVQTWTSGGCTVTLDDQGNLTVTKTDGGDGRMDNYAPSAPQTAPWRAYYRDISRVIVMDGVTHIGNFAFYGLSDAGGIRIQATVTSIGTGAFAGCWSAKQIEFLQEEWAVTDIGDRAFALGTSKHPVTCTVYSPGSNAQGRLNAYGGEFTTFAYADNYEYPVYPRQLVVKTIILLDGGGQYVQDGVFHPNFDYPNSPLAELVINAVVHPGGTVTLGTTDDGGSMRTLLTMENDGVDKWISFKKGDGTPLWEGQKFDWWDVHIFYVSNKIGEVEIEGEYYGPQMYLPDGTKLAQNHVYVQAGKYGDVEDVGAMVNDKYGMSDLTVKMGGVWAFSTQFSNGTNIQGSHVEWGGSSWSWDMNSTLVVFALTMLMASIVLFYRYGYNIYDILLLGGSLALLWVSFQG